MNCFEARQDFAGLWRRTLDESRRAELTTHLRDCAKCDHAFRVFALSAAVLQSDREPPERSAGANAPSIRRPAAISRQKLRPRRWFAICAAVTFFVAASLAAWVSVTMPVETLTDTLDDSDAVVQQVFGPDLAPPSNDFAG